MPTIAFYDTKSYDRKYFENAPGTESVTWRFHEFRLSAETASTARGALAVCIFVNDRADRACIEALAAEGVKLIALRCAGFNNVDLTAAKESGIPVVRVPAYSPHAVAEHTVALLLALNRKIHRAYNRVRDLNFSLNGLVGFDLHGKTVGIVGTGRIGKNTAGIFAGFGTRILAYDPYPATDWAEKCGFRHHRGQRIAAAHRQYDVGNDRRGHLGVDVVSGRECDHSPDDRLAGYRPWPQTPADVVDDGLHDCIRAVWPRAQPHDARHLPHFARRDRWRLAAVVAGRAARILQA